MKHFEVETSVGSYPACNPFLPANVVMTAERAGVSCKRCRRTKVFRAVSRPSLTKTDKVRCGTLPCPTCPWRKSSKVGGEDIAGFSIERMRGLRNTVGDGDDFRPIMACHHSSVGADAPCVGYVAVEGHSNISVRVLTSRGVVNQRGIDEACAGIELWGSFAAMLAAYEAAAAGNVGRGE